MSNRTASLAVLERYYPLALGLLTAALLFGFKGSVLHFASCRSLSFTQLYAAVFGWASVQTGSLLGVYGMIYTKTDGFVGKLRGQPVLDQFYFYTKRSLWLGFALTITSIPIIAQNHDAKDLSAWEYFVVAAWFALFVVAFASFMRVIMIFGAMVSIKDHERIPG